MELKLPKEFGHVKLAEHCRAVEAGPDVSLSHSWVIEAQHLSIQVSEVRRNTHRVIRLRHRQARGRVLRPRAI